MDDTFSDVEHLIEQRSFRYSIFILTGMINHNVNLLRALILRCKCYFYLEFYIEAIEDANKALSIDKTLGNAYIYLSKCYTALPDLNNAMESLTSLIDIDPDNSYAKYELDQLTILKEYFIKATKAKCDGDYMEAIEYINKCLEKKTSETGFKLFKAECLIYLKQHTSVLQIVNNILIKNKSNVRALYINALNLIHEGNILLGMDKLQEICLVSVEAQKTWNNYHFVIETVATANNMFANNKYEEGNAKYKESLLSVDKHNKTLIKSLHIRLATVNLKLKLYEESIIHCSKVLEMEPNNLEALKLRASNNNEMGDYADAIEDMRMVINIENNAVNLQLLKVIELRLKHDNINNYKILGVFPNSPATYIKSRYHTLALQYHPDKHSDKPTYIINKYERKFTKINEAYQAIKSRRNK